MDWHRIEGGGGGGGRWLHYSELLHVTETRCNLNSGHVSSLWPVCDFTYPYKVVLQCTHVPFGQSVAEMCKGELECAMNSLSKQTALYNKKYYFRFITTCKSQL